MRPKEQIRQALSLLFQEGSVVELRALGERTHYGYYTDHDKLARDAAILDSTPGMSGIYVTLNRVNPVLISRCANRIKKAGQREPQTADGDIIRRSWLPIDIDPVRPAGISSSDEEHTAALAKAAEVKEYLTSLGWPDPISADSGNGAHLLYQIDLPITPENGTLIKDCLLALDQKFSDEKTTIDTSVANPARIWKLYGTRSKKGDHTPERPHRIAQIISIPEKTTLVMVPLLMTLASQYERPDLSAGLPGINGMSGMSEKAGKTELTGITEITGMPKIPEITQAGAAGAGSIDLAQWLTVHGLSYTEKPYHAGRLFVFDECPFSTAHKDGAYAIQFPNGAIFAGCHHNSCGGNSQRWQELKTRFDGQKKPKRDYDQWKKDQIRKTAQAKAELDGAVPYNTSSPAPAALTTTDPILPENDDLEVREDVIRILHEGDPIRYILDTFAQAHEGDEIVAKCLLMSLASRLVENSKGLHVLVTGESGKGKSHAFETMMDLIPQEYCVGGRLTDKALFYQKDLRKGSVICLDDVSLSQSLQETLKGVTTSFRKPFIYRTLDKDRNSLTKVIPERCLWWIAKKEGTGDDQVWNRMLTVWIDDSQEQDDLVLARELEEAARPGTPLTLISREMRICRALWNHLASVSVRIPFARSIRFTNSQNRRNSTMLLDLVRSIAFMYQFQRKRVDIGGMIEILAEKQDFEMAREIYLLLNGACGAQMTKMTSTEQMLVDAIRASGKTEFTVKELQKLIRRSQSTVSRLLSGNPNREDHDGLLEKCPPLSFYDRLEPREDGGYQRGRIYTWDYEMDEIWSAGVTCWLDESAEGTPNPDPGDDPDGAMHLCTPMHDLCTPECIDTAVENESVSDNNDEMVDSSASMHTPEGAYRDSPYENHSLCAPENNAYILSKSQISSDVPEKEDKSLSTSMHQGVHNRCIDVHSMHRSDKEPEEIGKPEKKGAIMDIHPDMFHLAERLPNQACDSCGRKGVTYREKGGGKNPPGQKRRMICERCYSAAVSREVMTYRALPGVLPLHSMKQTDRSLGRCHLCRLHPVTWIDDETKIGLCERCYHRERFSARNNAGGAV
ncbi:hypothetical protein [Methanospirillum hungatei]|uniref:hypothetical protein n=1 Tax=Methanospirillum hungatei TaxID=2203 RepID=UPI0026EDA0AE|nr:hypothetical protein [Methanospirillum hungatei]MCA1917192.1 hypothetical protein [Methanospirillum hungatei]